MIQNPALFALAVVVNEADPSGPGGSFAQDCVVTKVAGPPGDYLITFNRVVDHDRMVYDVTPRGPVSVSREATIATGGVPSNTVFVHIETAPAVPPGQAEDSAFSFTAYEISPASVL